MIIGGVTFLIGVVYRGPGSSPEFLEHIHDFLVKYVNRKTRIIITGDFNVPGIKWNTLNRGALEVKSSESLLDMEINFGFTQIVNNSTRDGNTTSSMLDLVFISKTLNKYGLTVHEGISDYKLLHSKCKYRKIKTKQE